MVATDMINTRVRERNIGKLSKTQNKPMTPKTR